MENYYNLPHSLEYCMCSNLMHPLEFGGCYEEDEILYKNVLGVDLCSYCRENKVV